MLLRNTGWRAGGWTAALDSAQAAAGGLLRRGVVRLLLHPEQSEASEAPEVPDAATLLSALRAEAPPVLGVAVWARGLQALAGAADAEPEEMAAGIDLDVAGRRLPPLVLFTGQVGSPLLSSLLGCSGPERSSIPPSG